MILNPTGNPRHLDDGSAGFMPKISRNTKLCQLLFPGIQTGIQWSFQALFVFSSGL